MMRAVVSAPPAGGYGTMTRTGRLGHVVWASAWLMSGADANPANSVRRVRLVPDIAYSSHSETNLAPDRSGERPLRLVGVLAVTGRAAGGVVELVVLGKALRRQAAGIGAVAAPVGELLERQREDAARRVGPGQPIGALECLNVGETAVLVTLQPHTAAARHVRYLVEREDDHLAVLADRRHQFAFDRRDGARRVGRLDVEHLLALARISQALILGHDKAPARLAGDDQFAAALIAEHGNDIGLLLELDVESDRLAVAAAAR